MKNERTPVLQQEHFDSFKDLVEAADTKYTLSFKAACKQLKCSRQWALDYIRPYVPSIYLSNGKSGSGPNYAALVSKILAETHGTGQISCESLWFDEEFFRSYLVSHIVSCTKRAKQMYITALLPEEQLSRYFVNLMNFIEESAKTKRKITRNQLQKYFLKYVPEKTRQILQEALVYKHQRSKAPYIDVPFPDTPINEWQAVHDLLDYGDDNESIYRFLFQNGYIRIELRLPDKNGVIRDTGKIYYIQDPEPAVQKLPALQSIIPSYENLSPSDKKTYEELYKMVCDIDPIIIKEEAWQKLKNMK